ncbi:unnamed protein product [Symbiodinium natans]|uniref:Uncharacterized protein n=1 Tax=Symbiodinium natans TaxID=878477 RepID=A0A812RRP9_9DINO|nr:unnamed protein product [Symbiodinium natans]
MVFADNVSIVRITFKEDINVAGRAGYFDGYGIIRVPPSHAADVWGIPGWETIPGGFHALLLCVTLAGPRGVQSIRAAEEGLDQKQQVGAPTASPAPCPVAAPREGSRSVFEIDAVLFQELSLWQIWTIRAGQGCDGAKVGRAILAPEIDAVDPTNKSNVIITISGMNESLDVGPTLSVCATEPQGRCVAELRLNERPRRLVDLFIGVLNDRTVRAFRSLHPSMALLFEVLVAAAICVVIYTVAWFVYLAHTAFKEPPSIKTNFSVEAEQVWGLTEAEDIIAQGLIDVLFFVIGCGCVDALLALVLAAVL